jgi:RNA polymerase sigma-70 factor (ECF subfamily)
VSEDRRDTEALLRASHAGSRDALDALLAENLDWLRARVKARLGAELRDQAETADYVQDVLVDVLRCGPRFVTRDVAQARALLARIVENVLSDRFHWFHAAKRSREGMAVPASDTVLELDGARRSITTPSEAAARREEVEWIRLALELLPSEDRAVLWMREWEGRSFAEIAELLATTEDAARMRFQRAVPRLADRLEQLRAGRVAEALRDSEA